VPRGDRWVDRTAGSVVRPYAVTGGRTQPVTGQVLDLIAVVVAAGQPPDTDLADAGELGPEHRRILGLARRPVTVADIAAWTELPVGVVRVLLSDLILSEQVVVQARPPADDYPSTELLREVLNGLRAL
jgi:hypothetical protein